MLTTEVVLVPGRQGLIEFRNGKTIQYISPSIGTLRKDYPNQTVYPTNLVVVLPISTDCFCEFIIFSGSEPMSSIYFYSSTKFGV
jgi:hypothetical protein